jgi:hypothetical protein
VACDRHHEPEVRLDEPPLRLLVALVLPSRELALLGCREQPTVSDLTDVELERIASLCRALLAFMKRLLVMIRRSELRDFSLVRGIDFLFVRLGDELEARRSGRILAKRGLEKRSTTHPEVIGTRANRLENGA